VTTAAAKRVSAAAVNRGYYQHYIAKLWKKPPRNQINSIAVEYFVNYSSQKSSDSSSSEEVITSAIVKL